MGQENQSLSRIYSEPGFHYVRPDEQGVRIFSAPEPGQEVVAAGYIGLAGTVWMARHKKEELLRTLPRDYIDSGRALLEYIEKVPKAAVASQHGIVAMHFVTEGGIFSALWELAKTLGTGLYIFLKDIPVKQQTIEFCEVFDLNPYQLLSGGCVLMVTENGWSTVNRLKKSGIPGVTIGELTCGQDRVAVHDDICRYLTGSRKDELCKII